MKKLLIVLSVACVYSTTVVSCSSSTKENTEQTEEHDHAHVYQCPMDCEKGKIYEAAGSCPVCGMDLEAVDVEVEDGSGQEVDTADTHSDDHEGHEH